MKPLDNTKKCCDCNQGEKPCNCDCHIPDTVTNEPMEENREKEVAKALLGFSLAGHPDLKREYADGLVEFIRQHFTPKSTVARVMEEAKEEVEQMRRDGSLASNQWFINRLSDIKTKLL